MDRSNHSTSSSPTKKQLIAKILKQYPDLTEKEMFNMLRSIKRFVDLVRKLRTEPQAQIIYKEKKIAGQIVIDRIIQTDIEELAKAAGKSGHLKPAFEKITKLFPERKHGRRIKKV